MFLKYNTGITMVTDVTAGLLLFKKCLRDSTHRKQRC